MISFKNDQWQVSKIKVFLENFLLMFGSLMLVIYLCFGMQGALPIDWPRITFNCVVFSVIIACLRVWQAIIWVRRMERPAAIYPHKKYQRGR